MTGDKPDPRLRTPMQWAPRAGVGFTSGKPWESPQPDSLTTNVAVEDADSGSMLNLYRRLIHLRRANAALATGRLVPLSSSSPQIAAYLRRTPGHAVLVVANLATTPASGVSISSGAGTLPPGRYVSRNLLGSTESALLEVSSDGRIRTYPPVSRPIAPREVLVLDLIRR